MATDGVRRDEARDPVPDVLEASGLVDGSLVVCLADAEAPMVSVRPAPDDGPEEWVSRLEGMLGMGPSARVGVVAADPALAAALAVRLAVSVADGGRRVVVVDGSVHRPVLAKALEGDGEEGLVDSVVFGVSTAVTARRTLAPGVSLMTSGSVPVSSSEVFAVDGFGATLGGFAQDVAVVVALPAEFLVAALHAFSHVVAAGRSVEEIRSIASTVRERRGAGPSVTIAALAARPRPEPPAAVVERERADARPPDAQPTPQTAPQSAAPAETRVVPPPPAAGSGRPRRSPARSARLPEAAPAGRAPAARRSRGAAWWVVVLVAAAGVVAWRTGVLERVMEPGPPGRVTQPQEPAPQGAAQTAEPGTASDAPGVPEPAAGESVEPAAAAEVERGLSGPGGRYVVFVSSHRTEAAALADAETLEGSGVLVETARTEVGDSGTWYRVRVSGGYPTLAAAREALDAVKALEYAGAWIERAPGEE